MYDFDEDLIIRSWFIGEKHSMLTYRHTHTHTDTSAYRVALQFYSPNFFIFHCIFDLDLWPFDLDLGSTFCLIDINLICKYHQALIICSWNIAKTITWTRVLIESRSRLYKTRLSHFSFYSLMLIICMNIIKIQPLVHEL